MINTNMYNTKLVYNSCGAEQVPYGDLMKIKNKRKSATHEPIQHYKVADAVESNFKKYSGGYEIKDATYGLSHDGERCFGIIWLYDPNNTDWTPIYIFRNSNDMAFSLRCGTGGVVGICTNLMFVAEKEIVGTKHTKNILDTLNDRLTSLNKSLLDHTNSMSQMYDHWKRATLSEKSKDHLIMRSVAIGACKKTKIDKIDNEFLNPTYQYEGGKHSAWALFNAFTHINKGLNYVDQITRTQKLHKVFNHFFRNGETRQSEPNWI